MDGRKYSRSEKRWFDLLYKYAFFESATFTGKKCDVCLKWDTGIKDCKKGRLTWFSDSMPALAFAATARRDTER